MEMIIVLLLSTVVTGIAYLSYTIIARQFSGFTRDTSAVNQIMRFDRALTADFSRSETIRLVPEGFNCIHADTSVNYRFADSLIIRNWNDLASDTFRLAVDSLVLDFEGKEQYLPGRLIDKAKVCFRDGGRPFQLVKRKWYSAEVLLNNAYGRN